MRKTRCRGKTNRQRKIKQPKSYLIPIIYPEPATHSKKTEARMAALVIGYNLQMLSWSQSQQNLMYKLLEHPWVGVTG